LALPFIQPWMLAGTAMGSAPVIIHLLNRQRYKRITWAAMHWLLASFKKSSRRLQIEDLILLIIRILVLVLLALALARPFLAESGSFLGGKSHVHRLILLDTSFSMGYGTGGKNAFVRAKEIARDKLTTSTTLSSGDAVTVIYATDRPRARVKASTNLNEVYREVDGAELSHAGTDPVGALTRAFDMLDASKHPRKEIFLVTDMTRTAWMDPEASTETIRGLAGLQKAVKKYRKLHPDRKLPTIFLLDVGEESRPNMAVTSLKASLNVIAAKSQVVFKAEIANYTSKDRTQLPVTFKVNGERVSSQYVDVKAGDKPAEVMFFHQFETPGPQWVTVQIEADRLPLDDSRHMAVPVVPSLKLLLVDGEEKADPFESECGLLSRALSIPLTDRMAAMGLISPSFISTRVITDAGLGDAQFEGLDMVILANVAVIPEDKIPALRKFVREGGALLIFVGDNVGPDIYNEKLFTADDPMLPCRLTEPEGTSGDPDATKWFAFAPDDSLTSLLPTFAPTESRAYLAGPERQTPDIGVKIFRRYRVKIEEPKKDKQKAEAEKEKIAKEEEEKKKAEKPAPEADKDEDEKKEEDKKDKKKEKPARGPVLVPLKYTDGEPAILIREYGLGRVCLVTTTADTHWTNLPSSRIVFLPAMHDMVYHLVRERGKKHNLRIGGAFSVRWPAEELRKEVVVLPPEGHQEDKATVKPEIDKKNDLTTLTFPRRKAEESLEGVRWAGPYKLNMAGEEELRDIFVANVEPAESDLAGITPAEIRDHIKIKDLTFVRITDRGKIAEAIRAKASGKEFWRNLCWTVLFLAVVETFLAWFFGRKRW
jgi:Aerotolerance regulator N-terminal/von Willebrand factor type A domain